MTVEHAVEMEKIQMKYDKKVSQIDSKLKQIRVNDKNKIKNMSKLTLLIKTKYDNKIRNLNHDNAIITAALGQELSSSFQLCKSQGINILKEEIILILNKDSSFPRFLPQKVDV